MMLKYVLLLIFMHRGATLETQPASMLKPADVNHRGRLVFDWRVVSGGGADRLKHIYSVESVQPHFN